MSASKSAYFKISLVLLSITGIAVFSYIRFQSFRPAKIRNSGNSNTQAAPSSFPLDLPSPPNSKELSSSKSSVSAQVVLETTETKEDVYNFYKNILLSKGWEIKADTNNDASTVTKYQKENESLAIIITKDTNQEKVIVSLGYSVD